MSLYDGLYKLLAIIKAQVDLFFHRILASEEKPFKCSIS